MSDDPEERSGVPSGEMDDYSETAAVRRREHVEETTGVELDHVGSYSFEPSVVEGNIENFLGVAQVPIGLAGPLAVDGEDASGEFLVPMATTEGTLVASYNRGMKACTIAGGVMTTITDDGIGRGPVFEFASARDAAAFCEWVETNVESIREQAEATSEYAELKRIKTYPYNNSVFTNFLFRTGDAAGQNMVGLATSTACAWIIDAYPDADQMRGFRLAGNTVGEKRATELNRTVERGKQVTAEATIPASVVEEVLNTTPEAIVKTNRLARTGAFLTGGNSTAGQVPNAVAALFIATGQDEANVVEASAASMTAEVTHDGGLYTSVTIPSLVTATVGGGTHLPTQRECLSILGCLGSGKVEKFTEIVAAVALAGDLSLLAAISAEDWVDAHESLGRNRDRAE